MSTATIVPTESSSIDGTTVDDGRGGVGTASRTVRISKRAAVGVLVFLLIAALTVGGGHYWIVGRFVESTDDAYIKADSSTIAPKVSGYVARIFIDDNQSVEAGQILAQIDEADFRTALDEAAAAVSAASASIANWDAQLAAQESAILQAQANVSMAHVALELSKRNDARRKEMARVGYGSDEQSDDASADYQEKASLAKREEAAVASAQRQIDVLGAQRKLAEAQLARAVAQKHQASLNLTYATIRAPIGGTVAARSIRIGQFVQAGTQLMELVPLTQIYIIANFKETQLTHMRPGQTVRVKVDSFPDAELHAKIASLAPASGMEFSLLPPDNATGNFTKIVQRVPIKIVVDESGPLAGRLRPGMSVTVSVDTKDAAIADRQQAKSANESGARSGHG